MEVRNKTNIKGEGPWEVELGGREKENMGLVKSFYLFLIS